MQKPFKVCMTLIIKNWAENFEKSDNRRLKVFSWVAVPTKMDGKKFRRLSKYKDGLEIFGIFILLLELAGKMPEKGVLKDVDGDLDYDDMELMTGFPSNKFKKAISVLCSDEIGWLTDDTGATLGQHSGVTQPTVQYNTVHNNTIERPTNFIKPTIPEIQTAITEKGLKRVNAETFWNYYESNGWKIGKNKMKSWKATLSVWESRNKDEQKVTIRKKTVNHVLPDLKPEEVPSIEFIDDIKSKFKNIAKNN
jgi:hypothetical protein